MHGCNFTEWQLENNNVQLNIKMITLLVLNYLTRVQSEYYFSSDANVNVIEKIAQFHFFLCAKMVGNVYKKTIDNSKLL